MTDRENLPWYRHFWPWFIIVLLGSAVFQQIMHLPVIMTERATIGSQLSRLRQFDAVREFFTGPLATVVLELPFAIMFIVAR